MKIFLANLNFCLLCVGYPTLVTIYMLFLGNMNLQLVTIPYRFITLLLSIVVIYNSRECSVREMKQYGWIVFYSCILSARMIYDFWIDWELDITFSSKVKPVLFWWGISLPAFLSIAKSYKIIDLRRTFIVIFSAYIFIALANLFVNKALFDDSMVNAEGRVDGGDGLNTISFGYCGVSLATLTFYLGNHIGRNIWVRLIQVILFCVGIFVTVKSGSRAPFMVMVMLFALMFHMKSNMDLMAKILLYILLFSLLLVGDELIALFSEYVPVLFARFQQAGSDEVRRLLLNKAMEIFEVYPLFGRYFTIYVDNQVSYSHNVFVDAAVVGGVFGLTVMLAIYYYLFKESIDLNTRDSRNFSWVIILFMQGALSLLSSGTVYYMPTFFAGCAFISLWDADLKRSINRLS